MYTFSLVYIPCKCSHCELIRQQNMESNNLLHVSDWVVFTPQLKAIHSNHNSTVAVNGVVHRAKAAAVLWSPEMWNANSSLAEFCLCSLTLTRCLFSLLTQQLALWSGSKRVCVCLCVCVCVCNLFRTFSGAGNLIGIKDRYEWGKKSFLSSWLR